VAIVEDQYWQLENRLTMRGKKRIRAAPNTRGKSHDNLTVDKLDIIVQGKGFAVMFYAYLEDPKTTLSAPEKEYEEFDELSDSQKALQIYISLLPETLKDNYCTMKIINLVSCSSMPHIHSY